MKKIDLEKSNNTSKEIINISSQSSKKIKPNRNFFYSIFFILVGLILGIYVSVYFLTRDRKQIEHVLREVKIKDSLSQDDKLKEFTRLNAQMRDSIIALKTKQIEKSGNVLLINYESESSNQSLDKKSTTKKSISGNTVTDIDGNLYPVVKIGSQVWMKKNLKTTKFNDGGGIPLITDQAKWNNCKSSGYCWYNNDDQEYGVLYGALYNWYTVNTDKLCPEGWHVPTDSDWTTLTNFVGGEYGAKFAASKLKSTGSTYESNGLWSSTANDEIGTNKTGFTALPGGFRGMQFFDASFGGFWWSSTDDFSDYTWMREIRHENKSIERGKRNKYVGLSIRCIKD